MVERPEDLNLPIAVISRIVKDSLPDGVNVSKEARIAVSKAASIFILYATSCANNFALKAKRKTLVASDIFSALEDMEFEEFIPKLKDSLEVNNDVFERIPRHYYLKCTLKAFRKEQKGKKEAAADKKRKMETSKLDDQDDKEMGEEEVDEIGEESNDKENDDEDMDSKEEEKE